MKKIKIEKKDLEYLYYEKELSMANIAKEIGCSYNTIKRRFVQFDIKKRTRVESIALSYKQKEKRGEHKRTKLNCPECSKKFEIKNARIVDGRTNFCSGSCSSTYHRRENPRFTGDTKPCFYCGKDVYRPKNHKNIANKRFCNKECFFNNRVETKETKGENNSRYSKIDVSCCVCSLKFKKNPSRILENIYCSYKCMAFDYEIRMIGENNPNYIDGSSPYYGPGWSKKSLKIRERDNFKCKRCLQVFNKKGDLDVHHIIPLRTYNNDYDSANKPSNLVSLCKACHKTVEHHGIDFELPSECIVQPTTD